MNYKESKEILNKIREKDEYMFRMAISHLMDVGIRHLTEDNVEYTCSEIMKQDDSNAIITNEYLCGIVKTARELANINHIHLLHYISKEVVYDV